MTLALLSTQPQSLLDKEQCFVAYLAEPASRSLMDQVNNAGGKANLLSIIQRVLAVGLDALLPARLLEESPR